MDARDGLTDAELLAAARSDPEAFGCFYDRYEASVLGYFMRGTGDPEIAADLTAEVFAAALGAAGRYRPRAPTAAAWLFTIAHNTLAKSVRRRRVEARARALLGMGRVELREDSVERVVASGKATAGSLNCWRACPPSSVTLCAREWLTSGPTVTSLGAFEHLSW